MNIFDPTLYADVARPLLEARTLPRWCYVSEEFYEREIERIFMRTWNFVDRVEAIPNPGDYITVETFAGPIIVVRDREGEIRAFANSCRHRGSRARRDCPHPDAQRHSARSASRRLNSESPDP